MREEEIEILIDEFLTGHKTCREGGEYREGTRQSYRYFLRAFIPALLKRLGTEELSDIDTEDAEKIFLDWSQEKKHKPSTIRSHKYALRYFLQSCGQEIAPETLSSEPWSGVLPRISAVDFDLFLDAVRLNEPGTIGENVCLIACLAYYGGLTCNEILKLHHGSFYESKKRWYVRVTAVSSRYKERDVPLPEDMENELRTVLLREHRPLFSLSKRRTKNQSYASQKRLLQYILEAAERAVNKERPPEETMRFNLKAFRTYRIYADLLAGSARKDVMKRYGVSEYYISHMLRDK